MDETLPPYKLPKLRHYNEDMSKRWEVEFWVWNQNLNNGEGALQRKQKRVPLRLSKKERHEFANEYIREISRALLLGKHIRLKSDAMSGEDEQGLTAIRSYEKILEVKKLLLKKNSFKDYRVCVERLREYLFETGNIDLPLEELTRKHCITFLDYYQAERSVSNRTRNNTLSYLRTLANDLVDRGLAEENPWSKIKKEKSIVAQNYPFSQYHKDKLIPLLKKDPQLWYACQFVYYLFRRTGELENMKISQINWQQKHVMIPNTFKSGEAKYPIISKSFEPVIEEMGLLKMNPDWYIFGRDGEPGPEKLVEGKISERFTKVRKKAGLDSKYSFYCWKHTGNLDAVLAGVNIKAIQQQNGHAKLEDTDNYLRSLGVEHNQQIRDKQPTVL